MIIGVGSDLCSIDRIAGAIERKGDRFVRRFCSEAEAWPWPSDPGSYFALRFAIKEACAKALGTGITDRVRWQDIEVYEQGSGLAIRLDGGALRRLRRLAKSHLQDIRLHTEKNADFVLAVVVIEDSLLVRNDSIDFSKVLAQEPKLDRNYRCS